MEAVRYLGRGQLGPPMRLSLQALVSLDWEVVPGPGLASSGGPGIYAVGGMGTADDSAGGPGGLFVGGTSQGDGSPGVEAIGGDGEGAAEGGYGLYAAGGVNTQFVALFDGDIEVAGNVSKAGGSFKIDHPLDPENKYLYHSFVESPDMMNIYNGNVVTDGSGTAIVTCRTGSTRSIGISATN